MNLTALLASFGVIFLAELPDKTMVASLVLGSRHRPIHVWVGVAAAFAIHVTLAVAAGSAISLLPSRVVDAVAALLFAVGAVLVLREGREHDSEEQDGEQGGEEPGDGADAVASAGSARTGAAGSEAAGSEAAGNAVATAAAARPAVARSGRPNGFLRVAATAFTVVFVAELGDLTQISTANLAARFSAPVEVWLGALLALWSVAALAIAGGRGLLRVLSVRTVTKVAAVAFTVLAALSLIDAIRG